MVILCGVCVWHSLVGAAAAELHCPTTADDDDEAPPDAAVTSSPAAEMTSPAEATSSSSPAEVTSSAATNASAADSTVVCRAEELWRAMMADVVTADRLALAAFGALYLLFHVALIR